MLVEPKTESFFWLVVCVLASWRLAAMLCYDAGPFNVITKVRAALVALGLGRLVACFHCTAIWSSFLVSSAVYGLGLTPLLLALAIAGAASVIERYLAGGAYSTGYDQK